MVSERGKGIFAMLLAGAVWGLSAIFYKRLDHIPALEVSSHRVVWSFIIFATILIWRHQFGEVIQQFIGSWRQLRQTLLAAMMISANWTIFILAVHLGYATEASLGYFIFPLFAVSLGYLVFRENLSWIKWLAVAMALFGVVFLTVGLGTAPWIALALSSSFSIYGMLKKRSSASATVSVAAEAWVISPFALLWLYGVHQWNWIGVTGLSGGAFGTNLLDSVMLAFSGVLTAGPLILMTYSTKRLGYAEVGLLQYVNPILQFLVAVFIFMEPFSNVHIISFSMIWLALVLYSADIIRQDIWLRKSRDTSPGDAATSKR